MSSAIVEPKEPSKQTVWLWIVGLAAVGVLTYVLRTSLNPASGVKEPEVVCLLAGGELLGIDGPVECYRKRLDLQAISYGTDGPWLVVVGNDPASSKVKSTAVLIDLRSGEVVARKPLNFKMPPRMEGLSEAVLVDAARGMAYFCGGLGLEPGKQELVQFDLKSLKIETFPLIGMYPTKTFSIQDDLGFCTPDGVYRFSRPPLAQKDGYDGSKLERPSFLYSPQSGLFSLDLSAGTVTHAADTELRPIEKSPQYPLAGTRLQTGMVAFDRMQNRLLSVGVPGDKGCPFEALDLTSGKVALNQAVPGNIEQVLLGSNGKLYLFDAKSRIVRRLDLVTTELTDYAKLGAHIPNNQLRLLWAR